MKPNTTKLSEIEKTIKASTEICYLSVVINFHGSGRRGLRSDTGHYTVIAFRESMKWETYDNMKTLI